MKLVLVLSALGSSILRRKRREKKVVGGWVMIINLARSAMAHEKQIKREKKNGKLTWNQTCSPWTGERGEKSFLLLKNSPKRFSPASAKRKTPPERIVRNNAHN
jgi:hypothetical protein